MPMMNIGRSSSMPGELAVLEHFLGEGRADRVEEAEGLVLLIVELGALHLAADDVMFERPFMLAAVVERLGIGEVQRQELLRLGIRERLRRSRPCG